MGIQWRFASFCLREGIFEPLTPLNGRVAPSEIGAQQIYPSEFPITCRWHCNM